ncbi:MULTISPECIES: GNAT family N-acetyltransferase [Bacillus cereus group]|uniref:GNAT family N-acetyltransferase n=1 Tax=Bacillus toyonensis TaxID=155322 RepID=A0AB73S5Z1_9BACI|nr:MULTISPECIES: GNAT family N-acetyltransferase [Bacillus cereus group]MBJ7932920.1 GNAT family N-acetyltransferase [Bacillus cereus group sp. N31]PEG17591.1 GNAT family N-acetyltransferase [Bacillus toyonensis]PEI83954.1 GNAT family N-acetyltransferase [Bacillus toyonensis]PEK05727.1 GNAT family N-acetyltransferase [Bacillus toyonensis]PEM19584.1 GNAT family N-acetyltransferase [Bacillus toyonensis]
MKDIHIQQIENLMKYEISHLVQDSKEGGFNFLIKLINEYENKINVFNKTGECLYGIFQGEKLIGIGGLNEDPYTENNKIGRVRRFYIAKEYRRKGLGRLLLVRILSDAKKYFNIVVLNTDTEQGDKFYTSGGFVKGKKYVRASHYLNLYKRM